MGTMHRDSMRLPAEYPASAGEPKLLTTDCTSSMPMDTMDCCKMDGTATLVPDQSMRESKNANRSPSARSDR